MALDGHNRSSSSACDFSHLLGWRFGLHSSRVERRCYFFLLQCKNQKQCHICELVGVIGKKRR